MHVVHFQTLRNIEAKRLLVNTTEVPIGTKCFFITTYSSLIMLMVIN